MYFGKQTGEKVVNNYEEKDSLFSNFKGRKFLIAAAITAVTALIIRALLLDDFRAYKKGVYN